MVRVDDAEPFAGGVTGLGLEVIIQLGPLALRDTGPMKPLSEVTVITDVGESPGLAEIDAGDAVMEKSGAPDAAKLTVSGLPKPVT